MKVDADSDGIITWDEFSTFMMLENQGTAKLRETEVGAARGRGSGRVEACTACHPCMPHAERHPCAPARPQLSLEFVRLEEFPQAPDNDAHKDSIMAIVKIPSQIGLHDKYATVSKDGTMKIWSAKELTLIKTIGEGQWGEREVARGAHGLCACAGAITGASAP